MQLLFDSSFLYLPLIIYKYLSHSEKAPLYNKYVKNNILARQYAESCITFLCCFSCFISFYRKRLTFRRIVASLLQFYLEKPQKTNVNFLFHFAVFMLKDIRINALVVFSALIFIIEITYIIFYYEVIAMKFC